MTDYNVCSYARFASVDALDEGNMRSGATKAWIFIRSNNVNDPSALAVERIFLRAQCEVLGYKVIGETAIIGNSSVSKKALSDILNQENAPNYIFSPSARCLSRDISEAFDLYDMMLRKGVLFKTADQSHCNLEPDSPYRKIRNALSNHFYQFLESETPEEYLDPDEEASVSETVISL